MKLSKEEVKELFEQRTEEYLLNYNTTLQELKERTLKLFDEKNNPIILEKYLELIYGLNSDILEILEEKISKLEGVCVIPLFIKNGIEGNFLCQYHLLLSY